MKLVEDWRDLHEGPERLKLDEAACRVGIARKTLDDYSLCIRRAKELGFNLNNLKNEKMGVLRKFLKISKNGMVKE